MPSSNPPSGGSPPSTRHAAPLRSADRLPLPVGQSIRIPLRSGEEVGRAVSEAVHAGGFSVVQSSLTPSREAAAHPERIAFGTLIAERKVRRVATSRSMRFSIVVLVGAGAGLGALDLFVGGSWTYAVPWVAVATVGAFLLWLRYGRSYESEVIAVSLLGLPAGPSSATAGDARAEGSVEESLVLWSTGRIRSIAFAGVRAAVDVKDCPVPLMDALTEAVRRFRSMAG